MYDNSLVSAVLSAWNGLSQAVQLKDKADAQKQLYQALDRLAQSSTSDRPSHQVTAQPTFRSAFSAAPQVRQAASPQVPDAQETAEPWPDFSDLRRKDVLVTLREATALSMEDVLRIGGLPVATLTRWENGEREPTYTAMFRLYDLYRPRIKSENPKVRRALDAIEILIMGRQHKQFDDILMRNPPKGQIH